MSYRDPEFFWLLILALLLWFLNFYFRNQRKASLQFSSLATLREVPPGLRARLAFLPQVFKALSLVLLIVALARPQSSDEKIKRNVEGIDIVIALDVSDSMLIEDMKPLNRLSAAKEKIEQFVRKRNSDRISVVVFAGESFTLVPLTLDYELLVSRVQEITTAQKARIKDGTALGVALANASGRLRESTAKSRVVIFMTDGENNSGTIDPDTGLSIAKGYGIKVYSIGLGRDGPTRIPVYQTDVFGNRVKTYQPFHSTVNEELLQRMASETGGKFYRADRENDLENVFNEIDQLERTKIDVNKYTRYTELYQNYLFWSLVTYLIYLFLQTVIFRRAPR